MGDVQEFRKGPIYSYENVVAQTFAPGNALSEVVGVMRYLDAMRPALADLEAGRSSGRGTFGKGRPPKYGLDQLLAPHLVTLLLDCDLAHANRRIQSDLWLRLALGYPPYTRRTMAELAAANTDREVVDPDIPSRQHVHNFVRTWLPLHAKHLEWLSDFAYVDVPYRIKTEFPDVADYTAVSFDSTRVVSTRRKDEGSTPIGKKDNDLKPGRRFHSVIAAKGVPVVLYGDCNGLSELAFARAEVPEVIARAEAMAIRAAGQGVPFERYRPTLFTGDNAFHDNELTRTLYEHDSVGLFRVKSWPSRAYHESFTAGGVTKDGVEFKVEYDVATDGTIFCPCDKHLDINERRPMQRFVGRSGRTGFIYVACTNVCTRNGARVYVAFNRFKTSKGAPQLRLVTPVNPADLGNLAILRSGTQAVEHLHSQLLLQYGLAADDNRGRRIITGDYAHRFYYTLAHALWNLTILFNLQDGRATLTEADPVEIFHNEVRNKRHIENKRQRGKAAKNKTTLTSSDLRKLNVAVFHADNHSL